jgi:hypothetical protein
LPLRNSRYAVSEIRTFDAIVVVGAGASFMSGMPMAGQLPPLIWQVLDHHEETLRGVCHDLGVVTSGERPGGISFFLGFSDDEPGTPGPRRHSSPA